MNSDPQNLRTPGPTPVPDDVLLAMSRPMISHRGPELKELQERLTARLQQVFQTDDDVLMLTASGTGALEAAVVNTLSPGDKVLSLSVGAFGDRFADIAGNFGAEVVRPEFEWGTASDPGDVRSLLMQHPDVKAVLATHNETSTGITNDLEAIAGVVKGEFGKLLLVDAISSLGSLPLPTKAWGCDVVVACSQKGLRVPPGLAFVSMNAAAWEAYEKAAMPKLYFDLRAYKRYLERGQPPFTPAVSLFYALDTALASILDEGLERVFERHARAAQKIREGVKGLGFELFADQAHASNTVTAVKIPDGMDAGELTSRLRNEFGVVVAGGQRHLSGKIFRIGHLGHVVDAELDAVLHALEQVGVPSRV